MKKLGICILWLLAAWPSLAQKPFIRLINPARPVTITSSARNYVSGSTCSGCQLRVNGKDLKVYPTGAFALQLDLTPGDTVFTIQSIAPDGTQHTQLLSYHYKIPIAAAAVKDFEIAEVKTFPSGNCWLMPGDIIRFRVKAQPGNSLTVSGMTLYEQPEAEAGIPGIYQGSYTVKPDDPWLKKTWVIIMKNKNGEERSYSLSPEFRLLDPGEPIVGKTVGALPYLEFGLGTDRLGGAKISYLDTAVQLHITGKFEDDYRVLLSPGHTAYVPIGNVMLMSKGAFLPRGMSGAWRVWGDDQHDYVSIHLGAKLPYTTFQQIDPARIVVDIYGATSNSNWITQLQSAQEISNVWYEQLSDQRLRVTIELRHHQAWGYRPYYDGNTLILMVKRQPEKLTLSGLTIAIDAGHGGSNRGAQGPTGVYEKTLSLQIAQKLEILLKQAGATVVMTRDRDESRDMIQRNLFLRMADPQLLVSLHLNSSSDPIHVSGTSTYYRYVGFRPLSAAILRHMLELGLHEYGNIGRFNFALNGPTEYPNALVETVFISNPEDEMKVLDPIFQQKIARAVAEGIKDFLEQAGKTK